MQIHWAGVRRHWAEAALTISGLAAAGILCVLPFKPSRTVEAKTVDLQTSNSSLEEITAQIQKTRRLIQQLGLEAVPVVLQDVSQEGPFHFETVLALSQLGPEAAPLLATALTNGHDQVRVVALRTLMCLAPRLNSREAQALLPMLQRTVEDPSNDVRFSTILLLGRLHVAKDLVLPGLIDALAGPPIEAEDDPIYIRQGAAYVLGKMGAAARDAVPALTQMLDDSRCGARQEAAVALWRITGDTNAVLPHLARMLEEPDTTARQEANTALYRIRRHLHPQGTPGT